MQYDYVVKILVPQPSPFLLSQCRKAGIRAQETRTGQVVIQPKLDRTATKELNRDVPAVPGRLKAKVYELPKLLADETVVCYMVETFEAGRTGHSCYVAAGPDGQPWRPYRLSKSPLDPNDWHPLAGYFTGPSLSRVEWLRRQEEPGETSQAVLSIDRATFGIEASGLVLRRETLLHEHVVGNAAAIPQLPPAVAGWQDAVNGLYARLYCTTGCDQLHYREPVAVTA